MLNQIGLVFSLICIYSGLALVYAGGPKADAFIFMGAIILAAGLVVLFCVLRDWLKWRRGSKRSRDESRAD
jgi:hypothetical protein